MTDERPQGSDWQDAVSEASDHVAARHVAEGEAAAKQRPKSEAPKIAAAVVVLALIVAWNVRVITAEPELGPVEPGAGLAWLVVDAVEVIEDFRTDEERLPAPGEVADLLDEEIVYTPGDGTYSVTLADEDATLRYDSTVPLETWMALEGAVPAEEDES